MVPFHEFVEIDRKFDSARDQFDTFLTSIGLSRHIQYAFYYISPDNELTFCGWDGETLPSAQNVLRMRDVGIKNRVLFTTYSGNQTVLHPNGQFERLNKKG